MKIPEPTMPPITIMVASKKPSWRRSWGAGNLHKVARAALLAAVLGAGCWVLACPRCGPRNCLQFIAPNVLHQKRVELTYGQH
jgi:hypothetical protein